MSLSPDSTMEPSSMTHLMVLATVLPWALALTRQTMSRLSADSRAPRSTMVSCSGS